MTKTKLSLIGVAVATAIAVPWVVQHQAANRLREANEDLTRRVRQTEELRTESARLSNELVQAAQSRAREREQASELNRLRGEVARLRAARSEAGNAPTAPATAPSRPPERKPRERWAFVGYTTPEAALESMLWAMRQGDYAAYRASLGPEMQSAMDDQRRQNAKSEAQIGRELIEETREILELPLDRIFLHSDGRVSFRVTLHESQEGDTHHRSETSLTFGQLNGEWKLANFSGESVTATGP